MLNQRALMTESSSDRHGAIALPLAAEGGAVVVHGRHVDRPGEMAAAIRAEGGMVRGAILRVGGVAIRSVN